MTTLDPAAIISWDTVSRLTGLSRSTVHRLRHIGAFPEPVRLSRNRIGWRAGDLLTWLSSRSPAREA